MNLRAFPQGIEIQVGNSVPAFVPAVLEGGPAVQFVVAGPIAELAVQAAAPTLTTTVPRLQANKRTSSPYNFSRPRRHSVRESLLA